MKTIFDITMSLDGFIAGTDVSMDHPMGKGGERLHQWIFGGDELNKLAAEEMFKTHGAAIIGKTMFDVGEQHWDGNTPFGTPTFVVTSKALPAKVSKKGGVFTFVNDGIESALRQARAAAGENNVLVMGGANMAQQFIRARLIDEMRIRIVSVLLGKGVRLFEQSFHESIELERIRAVEAPGVTHVTYRLAR